MSGARAAAAVVDELPALTDAGFDRTVDIRRAVHADPELAFEEHRTTTLVKSELLQLGLAPRRCPTATGAVSELVGGRPGRTVLIRADIDALPLDEEVDVAWRSRADGRMHACGHDGHVAMLLGVARVLAARAQELPGRYVFLFQPAEEMGGGALRMLEGGVLDGLDAERMLSVHLVSLMPTGVVAARAGLAMSEAHVFRIDISGSGGHGALVGADGNVVLAAAALAQRLGRVVEGMRYEDVPCACSAGLLHAGAAANVAPRRALLRGTLRTFTETQRDEALARLAEDCRAVAKELGVDAQLRVELRVPPVVNDAEVTARVRAAMVRLHGEAAVLAPPPVSPSDDVSEFLARIPGCHLFVGAAPARAGMPPMHHAPDFDFDERAMRMGVITLAGCALDLAAH